jgi:DNA replication and repair protein RecF
MYLTHLSLTNFRSFARLDLEIPRRAILLVGSNAQGKTSLLEAVYFLAAFTSFQTHADRQLLHFNTVREAKNQVSVGRLTADYQRGTGKHHLEVRLILEPVGVGNGIRLRKEILLDKVKRQAHEVIGHFNAVIFAPQMSQILEGGPDERRRYINMALAQTFPAYARTLSEYHQALTQRNALLKTLNEKGGNSEHLSIWDEPLTRLGSQIILWRIQALQELEIQARRIHSQITRGKEVLRLVYQPSYEPLPTPAGQISLPLEFRGGRTSSVHIETKSASWQTALTWEITARADRFARLCFQSNWPRWPGCSLVPVSGRSSYLTRSWPNSISSAAPTC